MGFCSAKTQPLCHPLDFQGQTLKSQETLPDEFPARMILSGWRSDGGLTLGSPSLSVIPLKKGIQSSFTSDLEISEKAESLFLDNYNIPFLPFLHP